MITVDTIKTIITADDTKFQQASKRTQQSLRGMASDASQTAARMRSLEQTTAKAAASFSTAFRVGALVAAANVATKLTKQIYSLASGYEQATKGTNDLATGMKRFDGALTKTGQQLAGNLIKPLQIALNLATATVEAVGEVAAGRGTTAQRVGVGTVFAGLTAAGSLATAGIAYKGYQATVKPLLEIGENQIKMAAALSRMGVGGLKHAAVQPGRGALKTGILTTLLNAYYAAEVAADPLMASAGFDPFGPRHKISAKGLDLYQPAYRNNMPLGGSAKLAAAYPVAVGKLTAAVEAITMSSLAAAAALAGVGVAIVAFAKGVEDVSGDSKDWGTTITAFGALAESVNNITFGMAGKLKDAITDMVGYVSTKFTSLMGFIKKVVTTDSVAIVSFFLGKDKAKELFDLDTPIELAADPNARRRVGQRQAASAALQRMQGIGMNMNMEISELIQTGSEDALAAMQNRIANAMKSEGIYGVNPADLNKVKQEMYRVYMAAFSNIGAELLRRANGDSFGSFEAAMEAPSMGVAVDAAKRFLKYQSEVVDFGKGFEGYMPTLPLVPDLGKLMGALNTGLAAVKPREDRLGGAFLKGSVEAYKIVTQLDPKRDKQVEELAQIRAVLTAIKNTGIPINNVGVITP